MSEPTRPAETRAGDEQLAELADEFLRRHRAGEQPTIDEYARRFPELSHDIREAFPAMLAMEHPGFAAALDLAPSAERAGAMIGRYKLLERIGEGGFGVVFMAAQQHPVRRKVALKLIKTGLDTKQVIARFEAERQALAMMEHANIARVLDAGATDTGRPYFVMELVRGVPITQYCDEHKLTPRARLELFVPVCRAVQHAHTKGIIHRDIKPTNVLVTLHDGVPVPKVIDFGVAKATGQQPLTEKTLFTQFAQMVGTPLYMSPEQAEMSGLDVDTRSDVYSLGVLLYELLTGTTPFDKERLKQATVDEVRRIIREEEPPRPSTRISTFGGEQLMTASARCGIDPRGLGRLVRGELDWIVMRALEKDRTRRYQTPSTLGQDVERYLAHEPVQARPVSAAYRFRRFARRNKVALVTGLGIAAVLVVATIVSSWQAVRARTAARAAQSLAAELALDKGQMLGESGEANLALLWLARSLNTAPPNALDFQDAIRASMGAWRRRVDALRLILPHDGDVVAIGFDPQGRVVTASLTPQASTVRRWNAATGQAEATLTFGGETVAITGAFNADVTALALGLDDGAVRLRDLSTGRLRWEAPPPPNTVAAVRTASFSPDGTMVLVGYAMGRAGEAQTGRAQLLDATTGQTIGPPLAHARPVLNATFHPDGRSYVTEFGTWASTVERTAARFFDLQGREIRAPLEHGCHASSVAFSPDGTRLLTGHWDRKAVLSEIASPSHDPITLLHEGPVVSVSFSPDGQTILTGSYDGAVRLWDSRGRTLGPALRQGHMVDIATFSPDGGAALVCNRGELVRLWRLAHHAEKHADHDDDDDVPFPLATSADGGTTLTQDANHAVVLRDAATGAPVGKALPHRRALLIGGALFPAGQRSACSSDRRRAFTVEGDDAVARLWDAQTGAVIAALPLPPSSAIFAAAFSPDGRVLVTGHLDSTAQLWDATTGKPLRSVAHDYAGPVFTVAFSPDGKSLATGSADNVVRFWNVETGQPLGAPLAHHTSVIALAFSPDGRSIVTGDADKNVQIWDVATRGRLLQLPGHRGGVNDVTFSADGRLVLTGSADGTARLWSATSGKPIGPPAAHDGGPVVRVAFSRDGQTIRTATQDQVTRALPTPSPMTDTPEEIEHWAQVATGMELESNGAIRMLEPTQWHARRLRLRPETRE